MTRKIIQKLLKKALRKTNLLPTSELPEIEIEQPEEEIFGDYSANIALKISKMVKKRPMEIAQILIDELNNFTSSRKMFSKIEAKEPGFINFFLSEEYLQKQVKEILSAKQKFGQVDIGKKTKIQVEFISANPTGPLTLGNGRGAFLGDVLANLLDKANYRVSREYYINDVGEQIIKLGHSVLKDKEAVYKGDYIEDLAKQIKEKDVKAAGQKAAKIILEKIIKPFVQNKLKINFDNWFSEKTLYQTSQVDKILKELRKKNLIYEKNNALWFKSTNYGDDKDRVLVKENGQKTYLASDIAYMKNKFKRGFKKLIYIWGADHFGYVARMKAAVQALGHSPEDIKIIIVQLVRLVEKGKEVRMSKRRGIYILLEDLIDQIGLDAARFFFLMRAADSHFNFDLALAKEQSEKNPVYYIQYASARMHSILTKSKFKITGQNLELLKDRAEISLIKQLIRLPEIIEDTSKDYQVQRLPQYALDLVTAFHKFYENCRVISNDKYLTRARLALVSASQIVLKNILDLMGISAPERM